MARHSAIFLASATLRIVSTFRIRASPSTRAAPGPASAIPVAQKTLFGLVFVQNLAA